MALKEPPKKVARHRCMTCRKCGFGCAMCGKCKCYKPTKLRNQR